MKKFRKDATPKCLYNIECPPALIYVNGVMPDIDNTFSIGIVGTRRATKYGIENSYRFAYALSKYGTIIVSGGALGVDGASHRGALATDGITICVRGCGLNCSYLREIVIPRCFVRRILCNDSTSFWNCTSNV